VSQPTSHSGDRCRAILYDKTDDFNRYISQFIPYYRGCGSYHDFLYRRLLIKKNLLSQGFIVFKFKSSLSTCYSRNHDLVNLYGIAVSQMTKDNNFRLSKSQSHPFLIMMTYYHGDKNITKFNQHFLLVKFTVPKHVI